MIKKQKGITLLNLTVIVLAIAILARINYKFTNR